MPKHGGNGPALPGPLRACFSAAREAWAASGSDGVGTSPQRDFRASPLRTRCQSHAWMAPPTHLKGVRVAAYGRW